MQPGREPRVAAEPGERADGPDPGLLRPVLRELLVVSREALHDGEHPVRMALVQLAHRPPVATPRPLDQLAVVHGPFTGPGV